MNRGDGLRWLLRGLLLGLLLLTGGACQPLEHGDLPAGAGSVRGTVLTRDGAPAAGAYVYAYRSASKGLRGPADFAARVDADGSYRLDVVQGAYYLIARLRASGAGSGPPQPGDAWAVYPGNPVHIDAAQIGPIDFRLQAGTGLHQVRQGSLASGDTGFTGRLQGVDGRPAEGAFVLAYRSADFRRMPDFTSLPAGPDGRFVLYLPEAGRYCLAARMQTRGQPRQGEPYGTLGQGEASCRLVEHGELFDIGTLILTPHRR